MSIRDRLSAMVDGMPGDASITLSVESIREQLEAEPDPGEVPDLLDLEQAGDIVGRAVSTVRTWCNQGDIDGAFKQHGREWRIPRRALLRHIESQQKGDVSPPSRPSRGEVDLGAWKNEMRRKTG